ncbi:MAG: hypothetical protein EOO09_22175, partial [Chitinophagaceae bacterium]
MRKNLFFLACLIYCSNLFAQKKPLDHTVYDGWQSIGTKLISHDGNWIVYTIDKQEGDKQLVIEAASGNYKKVIERGTDPEISHDSKWLVFKITPLFAESRDAKIKKKKADESPKDSLGIIELGKDSVWKRARVKAYTLPEEGSAVLVYHLEKPLDPVRARSAVADRGKTDSLSLVIDSLKAVINGLSSKQPKKNEDRKRNADDVFSPGFTDPESWEPYIAGDFADGDEVPPVAEAGTELVVRNLATGAEKTFRNVNSYL